jgi:hypothetical protein
VLYICDWLPPDFGAVGQYSVLFARELAAEGNHVVLAGLSSCAYPNTVEGFAGGGRYEEVRIRSRLYDKTSTIRRLLWTVGTNSRLLFRLWPRLRRSDTIVFTGSPPLFLHWIAPANVLLRKELVYRITDFHPECSMAQAHGRPSLLLRTLYRLTMFWRRRISRFEVLGQDQGRRLRAVGIGPERIVLKRDPSPVAITASTVPMQRPALVGESLVLLYSGNWGVAHDYETFLDGYQRHLEEGSGRFLLWLNAVGAATPAIERRLDRDALPYIRTSPVPLCELPSLLVTADAHLITLRDAFVGYVLPSKVYGCVASGKPVLFIGSAQSDVDLICRRAPIATYERVDTGDALGVKAALDRIAAAIDSGAQSPREAGGTGELRAAANRRT